MSEPHILLSIEGFRNSFEPPLSRAFVYRLVEDGTVKAIKPRKKMFIEASEIDRFLNNGVAK